MVYKAKRSCTRSTAHNTYVHTVHVMTLVQTYICTYSKDTVKAHCCVGVLVMEVLEQNSQLLDWQSIILCPGRFDPKIFLNWYNTYVPTVDVVTLVQTCHTSTHTLPRPHPTHTLFGCTLSPSRSISTLSLTSLTMSKYGIPGLTIKMSAPSFTSLSFKKRHIRLVQVWCNTHTQSHTHTHTYTHTHTHTRSYTHTHTLTNAHTHTHTLAHTHSQMHALTVALMASPLDPGGSW